jgi:hypothetical protein
MLFGAALVWASLVPGPNAIAEGLAYLGTPLLLVWLVSRPKNNTVVYGPQGQQVMVSEREAKRRVEKGGWTYQRSSSSS